MDYFLILGSASASNSSLNINVTDSKINGDLNLLNSSLYFSPNSILNVDGCINLNHTKITVNLKGENISKGKILLLNSSSSCISENSYSISYENTPPCYNFSGYQDTSSVLVIISKSPTCGSNENISSGLQTWQIAIIITVISVILFVIIALVVIFLVPKARGFIFPRIRVRNDIRSKVKEALTEKGTIEEKLNIIKREIIEVQDENERTKIRKFLKKLLKNLAKE